MKKIQSFMKGEKGNVLIMFAGLMVMIAFFLGIIIDVTMIYLDNNAMQNLLQIIREERFTHQDTIRYAENPAIETYNLAHESAKKNGFNGDIKVYFKEDEPNQDRSFRNYKIRIVLADNSPFYFGRMFGLNTIKLSAKLDGGESYGDSSLDVIWYPPEDVSTYNGLYSGNMTSTDYNYEETLPGGW